jgi:hypothetical protein
MLGGGGGSFYGVGDLWPFTFHFIVFQGFLVLNFDFIGFSSEIFLAKKLQKCCILEEYPQ